MQSKKKYRNLGVCSSLHYSNVCELGEGEKTFFVEKGPFYLNEKAAIFLYKNTPKSSLFSPKPKRKSSFFGFLGTAFVYFLRFRYLCAAFALGSFSLFAIKEKCEKHP